MPHDRTAWRISEQRRSFATLEWESLPIVGQREIRPGIRAMLRGAFGRRGRG